MRSAELAESALSMKNLPFDVDDLWTTFEVIENGELGMQRWSQPMMFNRCVSSKHCFSSHLLYDCLRQSESVWKWAFCDTNTSKNRSEVSVPKMTSVLWFMSREAFESQLGFLLASVAGANFFKQSIIFCHFSLKSVAVVEMQSADRKSVGRTCNKAPPPQLGIRLWKLHLFGMHLFL